MKPLLISFIICLNIPLGYAQWTKQDSIWLQNVLAGKDTIRLNPEFQNAIKNGTFITPGQPAGKMQMAPTPIPITKDFARFLGEKEDSIHRKIALKDLPPSVFWWYNPPTKAMLPVLKSIIEEIQRNPIYAPAGQFDLAKLTSRKEYVHKRNAKRDATWKDYDNLPTPDIIKKRKDFTTSHPRAAVDSVRQDTTLLARKDSLLLGQPPVN